jgi:hypothetical protein
VLEELLAHVEPPPDGDAHLYWSVVASAAIRAARLEGDTEVWLRVIDVLMKPATRGKQEPGGYENLVNLWRSRGIALSKAERIAEATESHQTAVKLASDSGEAKLLARAHRDFGLFLAEQKLAGAEEQLQSAVDHARQPDAATELGESLTALGVFIQHARNLVGARPILREAVSVMQPTDDQFLVARNHLNAIEKDESCGCGKMNDAVAQTIADMIRKRLPADLIRNVEVKIESPKGPDVGVEVARKPTPEEMEQINVVVHQAIAELKRAMLTKY